MIHIIKKTIKYENERNIHGKRKWIDLMEDSSDDDSK